MVDASREGSLHMSKHFSHHVQTRIRKKSLRCTAGMCLALLAWCPAGRAQTGNPAPASAEEVKQLRDVVQSLLTRVTELENEVKQRQPASAERTERDASVANGGTVGHVRCGCGDSDELGNGGACAERCPGSIQRTDKRCGPGDS